MIMIQKNLGNQCQPHEPNFHWVPYSLIMQNPLMIKQTESRATKSHGKVGAL